MYRLEQAGKQVSDADVTSDESFELDPLPCFAETKRRDWFAWVRELIDQMVAEYTGQPVLAPEGVSQQQPTQRPKKSKRTYGVAFHVSDLTLKKEWRTLYRNFVKAFRTACRYLEEASDDFYFPPGSFPPNAPFVPDYA